MKVLFAGTPSIAVPSLQAVAQTHEVRGVLTAPDTRKGRGKKLTPPPVKLAAQELGIPVIQHARTGREAREAAAQLQADILVVYAYGRIFGPKFLSLFPLGGINVHPSLLPKYRGSSPISSVILNGEEETGITIQTLSLECDAGDIILQRRFPLSGREHALELTDRCALEGASLLAEALDLMEAGKAAPTPQHHEDATYCRQIEKEHGRIIWESDACSIDRQVRAYIPWPGAYTCFKGMKLTITQAEPIDGRIDFPPGNVFAKEGGIMVAAGSGALRIKRLQLASRKEMDWISFLNGNPEILGSRLG